MSRERERSGASWTSLIVLAALLAACDRDVRQADSHAHRRLWPTLAPAYDAALPAWPPVTPTATIGRGVRPVRAEPAAIAPLPGQPADRPVLATAVHQLPGDGEAIAIVTGVVDGVPAVEAIAIDAGEVRWRDTTACEAPVVHVTAATVVCAGATGVRALTAATGAAAWRRDELTFAGADGDLVVTTAAPDRVVVIAAATGETRAEGVVPAGVALDHVRVACAHDGGFDVYAWSSAALHRFGIGPIDPALASMTLTRAPTRVEPCEEPALVELPIPGSVERELYALRREPLGFADGALVERGFWRRDLGEVGVATARGIEIRDVTLGEVRVVSDAQVGRELAARGTRRLVRAAGGVAALLDGDVPVAYLSAPTHVVHAALGDAYLLGGSWQQPARSAADRVDRFALPAPASSPHIPPVVPPTPPEPAYDVPDLPPELPAGVVIDQPGVGTYDVAALFLDPVDPARLYVATLEQRPDLTRGAGLAAFDLASKQWLWHAPEGCPAGQPVALGVARDVIVCGSRGPSPGSGRVRAIGRADGATRWDWAGVTVDAVSAGGGLVAIHVGRRALVLDAATGAALTTLRGDDGFAPRLLLVGRGGVDVVVAVERGAIVARLPRAGMLPVWAVAVDGLVFGLGLAGDRITAELTTGELYFLDPADGAAVAAASWAKRWFLLGPGDTVMVQDVDGPPEAPRWQVALFGSDGAPRAAVELALEPPWQAGGRAAPGAPFIAAYGPAGRFVAIVQPDSGSVRARIALPERAVPNLVFSSVIDGRAVTGAVLRHPLGVVLF